MYVCMHVCMYVCGSVSLSDDSLIRVVALSAKSAYASRFPTIAPLEISHANRNRVYMAA